MDFDHEDTDYGFRWGPVAVERTASDPRIGVVVTLRSSAGRKVEVRVSPSGRVVDVTPDGGDRYREALEKIASSPYWHEADMYAYRVLSELE